MRSMHRVIAISAAAALFVAACGDDDDESVDDPAVTVDEDADTDDGSTDEAAPELDGPVNDEGSEAVSGSSIAVDMIDFAFDPTFVTDGTGSVTVQLDNVGDASHTFTIEELGIDEVLEPGEQTEVTVELPGGDEPVVFICRFHVAQGMQGAFVSS